MNKKHNILYEMFPKTLNTEISQIINKIEFISPWEFMTKSDMEIVFINGEEIKIPDRIYYNFPREESINQLTKIQKELLFCIFSRHSDGFIREKCLKEIILSRNIWIIPFVIELLGEYVIEIIIQIKAKIQELDIEE